MIIYTCALESWYLHIQNQCKDPNYIETSINQATSNILLLNRDYHIDRKVCKTLPTDKQNTLYSKKFCYKCAKIFCEPWHINFSFKMTNLNISRPIIILNPLYFQYIWVWIDIKYRVKVQYLDNALVFLVLLLHT